MKRRWLIPVTVLVLTALAVLPAATATTAASPLWVKMAKERLSNLDTRSASSMTGYSRARFGDAWFDVDLNGCSTRNDILARDLRQVEFREGDRCFVTKGTLQDRYTDTTINFVQGPATSGEVQIDHVVALAAAWRTGAKPWTAGRRLFYANDDLVLLAVDGPTNNQKRQGRCCLAAAERIVPLPVRRQADRDQDEIRPLGYGARAHDDDVGSERLLTCRHVRLRLTLTTADRRTSRSSPSSLARRSAAQA